MSTMQDALLRSVLAVECWAGFCAARSPVGEVVSMLVAKGCFGDWKPALFRQLAAELSATQVPARKTMLTQWKK